MADAVLTGFVPNRVPLTAGERADALERHVDVLERQLAEVMRAHNDLADKVLAMALQQARMLEARPATDEAPELPARDPFKRHGKRH